MKKILFGLLLLVVFIGVLGAIEYCAYPAREATPEEKALLITTVDLDPFFYDLPEEATGTFTANPYSDGSLELEYELETDDMYLSSEVELAAGIDEAKESFALYLPIYKASLRVFGGKDVAAVEVPELFAGGDLNFSAIIQNGEHKVGNIIITQKDKVVYTVFMTGLYIDDPEIWTELLEPKLMQATNPDQQAEPGSIDPQSP